MSKPIEAADLPEDLARFAQAQVAAGRFATVEDVLRAGQVALERQQRIEQQVASARTAIADGDASPDATPGIFERLRSKHGLTTSR